MTAAPADPLADAADPAGEPEFASYEVGAGLGDAAPFLRATLADDPADGGSEQDDSAADEPRELRVFDRLARLDAGLPPLPPGAYPDEILMPPPLRPAAPAAPAGPCEPPAPVAVLRVEQPADEPAEADPVP